MQRIYVGTKEASSLRQDLIYSGMNIFNKCLVDENGKEYFEVEMHVAEIHNLQIAICEQDAEMLKLEKENASLKEQLNELMYN